MRDPAEEFGPYVVYEQIGVGGMATVHRAETQGIAGFSKQVALKRMLPSVAADANLVKSFIREARLASHLRHANVAQTYDLGKVGETYFIAMELVPGRNLREILKHCAYVIGHMPLAIAMNIVNQIADALDYAHNLCDETGTPLGIIHRDVSPANVIVSDGGIVKLIDFGIAKASAEGMQTQSGTVKGKFSYLAPECLLGHVDARSDLFALGVIAYELLTNRPLFQGRDDMDTLYRVKDMPILPPSSINPHVPLQIEAIIMTALDRDPEQRWQRATAMRQALTTETQRLGLVAHNAQVEEWIDRAFTQMPQDDSEPSIVINKHTVELAQGTVPDEFARTPEPPTLVRPSGSKPLQAQSGQWHAETDASTMSAQPVLLENTITDAKPVVSVFEVPTVAAPPLQQIESEWNAPSSVETHHDRPRLPSSPWSTAHAEETREVHHQELVDRTRPTSPSSPHIVQRNTPPKPLVPPLQGATTAPMLPTAAQALASASMEPNPATTTPMLPSAAVTSPMLPKPGHPGPTLLKVSRDTAPAERPPSEPPRRPSSPQPAVKRPSSPPPNLIPPSGARTAPQPAQPQAPSAIPMSGARTLPNLSRDADLDAATTSINVTKSAVIEERNVSAVLDDLEQRSSVVKPAASAAKPTHPPAPSSGRFLLALLVLIAAGGAAAVVYFALPYLT